MAKADPILNAFRHDASIVTGTRIIDWGMLPDEDHLQGGGYHCGAGDLIKIGKFHMPRTSHTGSATEDYSVRQARDRTAADDRAAAVDGPDQWGNGGNAAWIRHNNLLVSQMRANDPLLKPLRAVNFTPDGNVKRRYDSLHPEAGIISSADTVLWHTHYEWWRDALNNPTALKACLNRMLQIMTAAVRNVPLSAIVIEEVRQLMQQMLVTNLGPDVNKIWLVDGMFRRDVTGMCTVMPDGTATGPVSNSQIFLPSLLGNLGNAGKVFKSGGDPDVWGVNVGTFADTVTLTDEQLEQIGDTMTEHQRTDAELEDIAFKGAQRAEKE